jgi:hypothetical protein
LRSKARARRGRVGCAIRSGARNQARARIHLSLALPCARSHAIYSFGMAARLAAYQRALTTSGDQQPHADGAQG